VAEALTQPSLTITQLWLLRDVVITQLWLLRDVVITQLWLLRDDFITQFGPPLLSMGLLVCATLPVETVNILTVEACNSHDRSDPLSW
jgi:hypothetical protein